MHTRYKFATFMHYRFFFPLKHLYEDDSKESEDDTDDDTNGPLDSGYPYSAPKKSSPVERSTSDGGDSGTDSPSGSSSDEQSGTKYRTVRMPRKCARVG